jgi:putative hydrolase of the HAD superfamily
MTRVDNDHHRRPAAGPFDAVLCDVDGVVRDWPSMEPIELEHGVVPGTLYTAAFAAHRLHPAITGRVTDAQWRAQVAADLAASGLITLETARGLVAAWSALRPTPHAEVVALLRRVRAVMPVALVSNATDRLEADLAEHGLEEFADLLVNTSRIGFAKPDPRVYAYAAERVGVPAGRCLFVDDSAENVEAARAAGMRAVHFRGFADLDDVLRPLFAAR